MENLWWGVLSVVLMTAALNRFFFPSEYHVDEDGIIVRSFFKASQLRWSEIRRFLHDDRGGYLSSRARSSFLDSVRGIHLLFAENSDLVIARIRQHLEREGESV